MITPVPSGAGTGSTSDVASFDPDRLQSDSSDDGVWSYAMDNEAPYIMVEVELDQAYVGTVQEHIVTPGMTGETTILTGEKSIFQYLLKPIYLTLDTAFHERGGNSALDPSMRRSMHRLVYQ